MPYAQNKIIINNGGLRSFSEIIAGYFEGIETAMNGGIFITTEMKENNLLKEPEALAFLVEQETDCEEADKACANAIKALAKFHSRQIDRTDRMRKWTDSKLP